MTTGNEDVVPGGACERFVDTTLELIAEEGGSLGVNLRAVSRRMGCAHTNAYNYFDSYGDLLWAAFRRALTVYGGHLTRGLSLDLDPVEYLRRTIGNLAAFPQENPGLYRFIGSDPLDVSTIPDDILETVTAMKRWFAATVEAAAGPRIAQGEAHRAADIVLAYVDGETLNLINGRAVPSEDLAGRIEANALRLFELLTAVDHGGPRSVGRRQVPSPDPARIFGT